jgi:hypothetical protein
MRNDVKGTRTVAFWDSIHSVAVFNPCHIYYRQYIRLSWQQLHYRVSREKQIYPNIMTLPSTYALQHSLPNRIPNQRPRSLSLSEYQPLQFDREALESAYQHTLVQPSTSSHTTSYNSQSQSQSNPSYTSSNGFTPTSVSGNTRYSTHSLPKSASTLSHHLKRGDNPHSPPPPPPPPINIAGVGAGHSLTPPHSPFHSPAQQHQATLLGTSPPELPPRPNDVPLSTFRPDAEPMEVDEGAGYMSDASQGTIGMSSNRRGKRRALPPLPTDVPIPVSLLELFKVSTSSDVI